MTIKTSDGIRIIQFIEKTLKITLPKSGFLAGQSVCSALLYLNSKQKDFHVNDLDIFLPKEKLTTKEIQFFNRKQTPYIVPTPRPKVYLLSANDCGERAKTIENNDDL